MSPLQIWNEFVALFATGLQTLADAFSFLGSHQWAAAIVVLTLIVRTLVLPLAVKQIRSMQAMQRLQPEMKRLQQKYKKDRQRLNQEMMELYKREGVNPLGGCLPMIAQGPILFAMFYAIRNLTQVPGEIAERLQPIAEDTGRSILDLAQQRGLVPEMPFLGIGDLAHGASSSPAGWLLLALMTVTSFLSMRQMRTGQNPQQQKIMQLMPLFFVFIMLQFPAGLVLYWATQNVYQFAQQTIMLRGSKLPEPPPSKPAKPSQPAKGKQIKARELKGKQTKPNRKR